MSQAGLKLEGNGEEPGIKLDTIVTSARGEFLMAPVGWFGKSLDKSVPFAP